MNLSKYCNCQIYRIKHFEFIDGLSLPSICIFLPKEILESKCVSYFRSLKIQLSGIFIVASQQIFCNLDWALRNRKKDQLIKQKITNPKRIICSKFYINRKGSKSLESLSLKSFLLFPNYWANFHTWWNDTFPRVFNSFISDKFIKISWFYSKRKEGNTKFIPD